MAPKMKALHIVPQLTQNMQRVICLLDEFEEWATAQDLHTNHTTLHPLNRLGVIEGIKTPGFSWRWRLTPLGRSVLANLGAAEQISKGE